jgi:hypothetical protein
MIQVADLYAWILWRYAEIVEYGMTEESTRWPKRTDSAAAEWFNSIAPKCLVRLG